VACRITIRGTHRGDFQGIPATGRRIRLSGIDLLRFEGEKIAERWGEFDDTELFKQIGATPPPAAKDQE
jgi:predicted ester cyclase